MLGIQPVDEFGADRLHIIFRIRNHDRQLKIVAIEPVITFFDDRVFALRRSGTVGPRARVEARSGNDELIALPLRRRVDLPVWIRALGRRSSIGPDLAPDFVPGTELAHFVLKRDELKFRRVVDHQAWNARRISAAKRIVAKSRHHGARTERRLVLVLRGFPGGCVNRAGIIESCRYGSAQPYARQVVRIVRRCSRSTLSSLGGAHY